MPSFQEIFDTIKQVLPRRSADESAGPVSGPAPITENEAKVVEQTKQTERNRWAHIIELGLPASMLVIGLLLTVLAQLVELWGILGFVLLAASPVVYCFNGSKENLGKLPTRFAEIDRLRSSDRSVSSALAR